MSLSNTYNGETSYKNSPSISSYQRRNDRNLSRAQVSGDRGDYIKDYDRERSRDYYREHSGHHRSDDREPRRDYYGEYSGHHRRNDRERSGHHRSDDRECSRDYDRKRDRRYDSNRSVCYGSFDRVDYTKDYDRERSRGDYYGERSGHHRNDDRERRRDYYGECSGHHRRNDRERSGHHRSDDRECLGHHKSDDRECSGHHRKHDRNADSRKRIRQHGEPYSNDHRQHAKHPRRDTSRVEESRSPLEIKRATGEAKGRPPQPGFEGTPAKPCSPIGKNVYIKNGLQKFKQTLQRSLNNLGYLDSQNNVIAFSFYLEKLSEESSSLTTSTSIETTFGSPASSITEKKYRLVICIGKSSNGNWAYDDSKENTLKQMILRSLILEDDQKQMLNISEIKIELVNRMADTFSYDYITTLALDYSKAEGVDIVTQLKKIKDEVYNKFELKDNGYIIDFIDLVKGIYCQGNRRTSTTKFPDIFQDITDLVNQAAKSLASDAGICDEHEINKIADFLWLFAHNPLCAEKNIWYTEQKIWDIEATQQLRVEEEQLILAYQPKRIKGGRAVWVEKPACLSCQVLASMRALYMPKREEDEFKSPVQNRSMLNPNYSGNSRKSGEPNVARRRRDLCSEFLNALT